MKSKFLLPLFIFVISLQGKLAGQNNTVNGSADDPGTNLPNLANITLPTPDAFNFTRYGNLPVGLFTGTAQFSIPVYQIKSGNLQHTVSLNYATNGVKIDEIPGRSGLGWTLQTGGVITRIVQNLPDEFSDRAFFHQTPGQTSAFYNFVKQASYATPLDFQPDEYSFSVNGLSGKFIQRENGGFKLLSAAGIKIEQNSTSKKFLLTGPDGTKYYFDNIEYTKTWSQDPEAPSNLPGFTATAWYLSKIISQEKDSIVFNYTAFSDTLWYYNGISEENSLYIPGDYSCRVYQTSALTNFTGDYAYPACLDPEASYYRTNSQITLSLGAYLSSIEFKHGRVELTTSSREDVIGERKIDTIKIIRTTDNSIIKLATLKYIYPANILNTYDTYINGSNFTNSYPPFRKRLFLASYKEIAADFSDSLKYEFTYNNPNDLPPRLSFSQDKFGYFNGKINTSFLPNDTWIDWWLGNFHQGGDRSYDFNYACKGVLTHIKYPTGGHTKIEYEPHKIAGYTIYQNQKDSVIAAIDTSTYVDQTAYSDTFSIGTADEVHMKITCDWASTPAEYFPEAYHCNFSIIDVSTGNCVYYCDTYRGPGSEALNNKLHTLLSPGVYKLKLVASQARLRVTGKVYKITHTVDTSQNVGIGGIRVRSIADYSFDSIETNRREFIYGNWGDSTSCSGTGIYVDNMNQNYVTAARKFGRSIYGSNESEPIIYCGNNIIHSNSVRSVYLNENGTVTYSKVIELNQSGGTKNNGGTEYNFHTELKSSALPLSSQLMTHVWSFSPFLADGSPYSNDDYKNGLMKSSLIFSYDTKHGNRQILREKKNFYSLDSQYLQTDTFYLVKQVRKRDAYNIGWYYFSDYDINKYFRYYSWVKLDSSIETTFADNLSLVTKMEYKYSSKNYNINQEFHYLSDGSYKNTVNTYPPDILPLQSNYGIYSVMTSRNMINSVIKKVVYKNGIQELHQNKFDFGLFLFANDSLYAPAIATSSLGGNQPEIDATFEKYDEKGNIQQYRTRNGVVNAIIWGYDKTYPVARITGISYDSAIAVLNLSVINNPANDEQLRSELNKLRSQLTGHILISTITYAPLIGITSQTDANNRTTFYEYDSFNRLKLIRDQNQNILKMFDYKYQIVVQEGGSACNTSNCIGEDKKCVNGVCETGVKICTSSQRINSNTWLITYHYKWSDNSISQNYQEYQNFACLILE